MPYVEYSNKQVDPLMERDEVLSDVGVRQAQWRLLRKRYSVRVEFEQTGSLGKETETDSLTPNRLDFTKFEETYGNLIWRFITCILNTMHVLLAMFIMILCEIKELIFVEYNILEVRRKTTVLSLYINCRCILTTYTAIEACLWDGTAYTDCYSYRHSGSVYLTGQEKVSDECV